MLLHCGLLKEKNAALLHCCPHGTRIITLLIRMVHHAACDQAKAAAAVARPTPRGVADRTANPALVTPDTPTNFATPNPARVQTAGHLLSSTTRSGAIQPVLRSCVSSRAAPVVATGSDAQGHGPGESSSPHRGCRRYTQRWPQTPDVFAIASTAEFNRPCVLSIASGALC